jgi:hypothetical protein
MGTSRALGGPKGPGWDRAGRAGRTWLRTGGGSGQHPYVPDIEPYGRACLRALADELTADPDWAGLRPAMLRAGERLVDALGALQPEGVAGTHAPGAGSPTGPIGALQGAFIDAVAESVDLARTHGSSDVVPGGSVDALQVAFVDAVAGSGNRVVDTAMRRAATHCAELLTGANGPIAVTPHQWNTSAAALNGDLLCAIYRTFFAEVVAEFLKTVIAAKIELAVPVLPALPFGAGHELALWVAGHVVNLIPDPCEASQKPEHAGESLADLGRHILGNAVEQALGLDSSQGSLHITPA